MNKKRIENKIKKERKRKNYNWIVTIITHNLKRDKKKRHDLINLKYNSI